MSFNFFLGQKMDMVTKSNELENVVVNDRPIEIPNKSTFKINEVCALTGIKSYVLRFWESEFDEISPIPSSSGQKLYELKDIEAILLIKKLLFEDKLSVERARVEIKKLLPERKLIESVYETSESSFEEDSDSFIDDGDELSETEDSLRDILNSNYSSKYDVKKLDPEVIQTLKEKFLNSNESTLEVLENSSQAINEAGISDLEPTRVLSAPSFTVRTLNDTEFSKLLTAKKKLQEMMRVLENEVSV